MLLEQQLTLFIYAALIGLFAVIYRHILAYEPILNWWFKFGSKFEDRWFWKPIWGCELCIAGQIALWTYGLNVFASVNSSRNIVLSETIVSLIPNYRLQQASVLGCAIFICEAIAFTFIIYKGYEKLKD